LAQSRHALHDRETKFCALFRATLASGGMQPIQFAGAQPKSECLCRTLEARSVNEECVSNLTLFTEFTEHFHTERNH